MGGEVWRTAAQLHREYGVEPGDLELLHFSGLINMRRKVSKCSGGTVTRVEYELASVERALALNSELLLMSRKG